MSFIEGTNRSQVSLLPPCAEDYVAPHTLVRVVDAFVASLNLSDLGFSRSVAAATGRPGFHPGDMLRLYIWGYLNQARSSRHLDARSSTPSARSSECPAEGDSSPAV
jgi:transposase